MHSKSCWSENEKCATSWQSSWQYAEKVYFWLLMKKYHNVLTSRKNVLSSTLWAIKRNIFLFLKPAHVSFSGEELVVAGGPKRNIFHLLMLSLKHKGILQGTWFSHDLHLVHSKIYEFARKVASWCILQSGSGPKCLSQEALCDEWIEVKT